MIELKWVPDNIKKLKDMLHHDPSLYGLPLFRLYYSTARSSSKVYNRTDGDNNMLHAFRIIIGLTWNWLVCNACGYTCSKDALFYTMTAMCRQCSTYKNTSNKLHKILHVNAESVEYHRIMDMYTEMLNLGDRNPTVEELRLFFINKLGKYAQQDEALTTFIPLDIQKIYRDNYGKDAIKQFRDDNQEYNAQMDITRDLDAWSMMYTETELRNKSWLSVSQVRRMLNRQQRNSKAKHGRSKAVNSDPAMSTSGSCHTDPSGGNLQ